MVLGHYRGRPLVVRVLRSFWRILRVCLAAFAALGPAMPPREPRARTAVVQYESAAPRRK